MVPLESDRLQLDVRGRNQAARRRDDHDLDEESVTYGEVIYRLKMTFEGQTDLSGINDAVADADADARAAA